MMESHSWPKSMLLGVQMLFVAFGALVLVPLLTGFSPSLALFTAGAGTLLFQAITRGKVPIFLASSFAFIAPMKYGVEHFGMGPTLGALAMTGLVYVALSLMVRWGGPEIIHRLMPPIVTGPVIMVIGLKLAPVAISMAHQIGGQPGGSRALFVAGVSLLVSILAVMYGRGMLRLIPVLCGITAGYLVSLALGIVDFQPLRDAAWFSSPWSDAIRHGQFAWPAFHVGAILYILPVALAPAIEHVGDILAISNVTGKDFIRNPGLHRTLLGDGLATSLAALLGGPPNTTYSEVTGAVTLTRAFNPQYMRIAAVAAMALAFLGKLGGFLLTIPSAVMGGIMILLFGMIAAIGAGTLIKANVDMSRPRNLVIASVVLVMGIGDMQFSFGGFSLGGIGLAGLAGVVLNLALPKEHKA